jgi:hypothetical protein
MRYVHLAYPDGGEKMRALWQLSKFAWSHQFQCNDTFTSRRSHRGGGSRYKIAFHTERPRLFDYQNRRLAKGRLRYDPKLSRTYPPATTTTTTTTTKLTILTFLCQ